MQCGGFLADKWLNEPEPDFYHGSMTPSQRKVNLLFPSLIHDFDPYLCGSQYLEMIVKAWGTWQLFQSLLRVLRTIGDKHGGLSIANIATRWVLEHPFVGAVIIGKFCNPTCILSQTLPMSVLYPYCIGVGARLGITEHTEDNQQVFTFSLTDDDKAAIEEVLDQSNGRILITSIGDCGAEYR